MSERCGKKGELIASLMEHPRQFLITIYIGNETVNVLISALITSIALHFFGSFGLALAIGTGTFLLLVFAEITPKSFALHNAERYALFSVSLLFFFHKLVRPLQELLSSLAKKILARIGVTEKATDRTITEEEIKSFVDEGSAKGNIRSHEKVMIKNVFELNDIPVEEIMTKRPDIIAVEENETLEEVLPLISRRKTRRLPVYSEDLDHITGVLLVKDILRVKLIDENWEHLPVKELMTPPFIIPETKRVDELLRDFQQKRVHLAVAVDEVGVTSGIATFDDILSELLGKQQTEKDEEQIKEISEGTFLLDASIETETFNERFQTTIDPKEFDTIGGFVFHLFGYLPEWGEKVSFNNFTFYVLKKKGFRIVKLKLVVR